MREIATYIGEHPFLSVFLLALWMNFVQTIVKLAGRRFTILMYGYPPPHCDVDGDPIKKEEPEEEDASVTPTPYWMRLFSLAPGCTWEQVQSRYRLLVKQFHPDMGGNPEHFRAINAAYREAQQFFGRA